MAGGIGSRFWPKSRRSMPKQFLDILGDGKSFLRHTFERFRPMFPIENFLVVTNRDYLDLVLEQIPELRADQVLCEPVGRNTAPCICYAAATLLRRDPQARMVVTPSDHFVSDEGRLRDIIGECLGFVSTHDVLMTVGVCPTRPETGYGYIQVSDDGTMSRVKSFTEKPDLELAQTFLHYGEFFWNSGIFVWRAADIMRSIEEYLPEHYALFQSISEDLGSEREEESVAKVFSECRAISIDFGVMERAENVYVRVGEFGWSDIGTWGSLYQQMPKDECGNVVQGRAALYDTANSMISLPTDKVAVVSGLQDYVVVDTSDVLMICPRDREQDIKKYVEDVKYNISEDLI